MAGMTFLAAYLGMLAGELRQLLLGPGVTFSTVVQQSLSHGHFFGCMGVGVTGAAIGHNLAMGLVMATAAFWHQGFIVILFRAVGVDDLVAFLAIELMACPIGTDLPEVTGVTLTALGW